MTTLWAKGKPVKLTDGRWEWASGRPHVAERSRTVIDETAEVSSLHLRHLHNRIDTGGADAVPLHIAWQYRGVGYVYDDQGVRHIIAGFVIDNQELRYILAGFAADDQETRFVLANFVTDDQELRYILAGFAADDQETRFILGNFVGDDQETRFIIAVEVAAMDQELRFLLANFAADDQETRFIIAAHVTDEQELRHIIAEFVADEQALNFILANFSMGRGPVYFFIEGTGIIVYEPAEGYLLDDSYVAARTKVSRLLNVRYIVELSPPA